MATRTLLRKSMSCRVCDQGNLAPRQEPCSPFSSGQCHLKMPACPNGLNVEARALIQVSRHGQNHGRMLMAVHVLLAQWSACTTVWHGMPPCPATACILFVLKTQSCPVIVCALHQ